MGKIIGWYKNSTDNFLCEKCFDQEGLDKEGYVVVNEEGISDNIYTCDKCGREFKNISIGNKVILPKGNLNEWMIKNRKVLYVILVVFYALEEIFRKEYNRAVIVIAIAVVIYLLFDKLLERSEDSSGQVRPKSPVLIGSYIFLGLIILFSIFLLVYYFATK